VICTHPGNNATCTQEGAAAPTPPTPSNCNGVEDDTQGVETPEASIGDSDTQQPPGVVCPSGEDEPNSQEENVEPPVPGGS
jgi:hypothetical protein